MTYIELREMKYFRPQIDFGVGNELFKVKQLEVSKCLKGRSFIADRFGQEF